MKLVVSLIAISPTRDVSFFFKDFIYLFLDRGGGREKEKERNINVWLPLMWPLLETWPATQARALTGNQISDPLVHRPALNPLSHTSQGRCFCFLKHNLHCSTKIVSYYLWNHLEPNPSHNRCYYSHFTMKLWKIVSEGTQLQGYTAGIVTKVSCFKYNHTQY